MIADKELAEYQNLCAALKNLHENYLIRKQELLRLLEELAALRKESFLILEKANRLTRHLSGRQRQIAGLSYHSGEIKARINQCGPVLVGGRGSLAEGESLPEFIGPCAENPGRRELKRRGLSVLGMIDSIRKNILQIDLLALRCRELILAIKKGMEAFRHEFAVIRRKIYPFGVFSILYRRLRAFWGGAYFSFRDMDDISALGNITGHVLKIADTPL